MIVVVPQYRLNVYGFYSTGDQASPGNYGLWDQRMALEWVNKEISKFGGDTSNVHIAGSSAGGASVAFQLQYDQRMRSQGHQQLFQKATVMSGGIYEAFPNVGRMGRSLQDWSIKLSRHMIHSHLSNTKPEAYTEEGSQPNTALMASTIKAMSTQEIAGLLGAGMAKFTDPVFLMTGAVFISQGPVVDGTFLQSRDPFNVKTLASAGNYSGYQITYGTTNGDGYVSFTGPMGLMAPGLEDYTALDARMNQLHKVLSKMSDTELADLWKNSWNPMGIMNLLSETKKNWINFEAMHTHKVYAAKSHNGYVASVEDKAEETIVFESDKSFTLPIMMELVQTRAAGAAVKYYHLARGCSDGSDACQAGKEFWANGYNLHGEDISFALGKVFCLANSTVIHRGLTMPCKGISTEMDKISSLQLIEYTQGNDEFETVTAQGALANENNFAVNADVFMETDEIKRVANFRQAYLSMRYQGRDMLWDAVEESGTETCGGEAQKKWSTAFDGWAEAQAKWLTSLKV